jgi:hypothetical protein
MPLNPLAPVTDYQSMLNRIAWFTTATALCAVWLLRLYVPGIEAQLSKIDFALQFGGDKVLPIPGGYLLPALAMGLVTRVYRLHSRISDWLGIREHFDVEVIMAEFASRVSVDLSGVSAERLVEQRSRFMRTAFYAFVGGSQPAIETQLIYRALDAWSWFWIGVEATLVFTLAGLGLVGSHEYLIGLQTIAASLAVAAIGLPLMRGQCRLYAVAQVRAILADTARADVVRGALDDVLDKRPNLRLAA